MESLSSKSVVGTLFVIFCVLLVLLVYVDKPYGAGEEVIGKATQILYINPKLESPYTRLTVALGDGVVVEAEGPPNIPIKNNEDVVLVKRAKRITGADSYRFDRYLEE
jgi:hypothetical protein